MIQRMQTVYLILASVFCGIMYFIPFSLLLPEVEGGLVYKLDVIGIQYSAENQSIISEYTYALTALLGLSTLLILVTIFLFKQRPLQAKLSRLDHIIIGTGYTHFLLY